MAGRWSRPLEPVCPRRVVSRSGAVRLGVHALFPPPLPPEVLPDRVEHRDGGDDQAHGDDFQLQRHAVTRASSCHWCQPAVATRRASASHTPSIRAHSLSRG